jgi:hypothetical protein
VPGGDFWAVDSDMKVLGSCEAPHTIHVPCEEDASLPAAELRRLAGGPAPPAPAGPPPPAATAGVAFLLAGASGVPGGAPVLLQLAAYLRRAGYFVVAALTRPFDFEGRRRLEEADALIEAMSDVAQLTVCVCGEGRGEGCSRRAAAEVQLPNRERGGGRGAGAGLTAQTPPPAPPPRHAPRRSSSRRACCSERARS